MSSKESYEEARINLLKAKENSLEEVRAFGFYSRLSPEDAFQAYMSKGLPPVGEIRKERNNK